MRSIRELPINKCDILRPDPHKQRARTPKFEARVNPLLIDLGRDVTFHFPDGSQVKYTWEVATSRMWGM